MLAVHCGKMCSIIRCMTLLTPSGSKVTFSLSLGLGLVLVHLIMEQIVPYI